MSQFFQIHPENPQARLVRQAAEAFRQGGVVVYPTDSGYALGCGLGEKAATDRIKTIRKLDDKHNFTLVCRDLSEIATYAKVNNVQYRLIRNTSPGPYTYILKASAEVPRRLLHPKRRQIGIRIPDNRITQALLEELGEPIMSTTLILPGEDLPLTDPYDIRQSLEHLVDLIIDGGFCGMEPTTVISLTEDVPEIWRRGAGDTEPFEAES